MRRRAKERQGARNDLKGNIRVNLPEGSDNVVPFPADSAQVRDELAKQVGVSPKTASDAIHYCSGSWPGCCCRRYYGDMAMANHGGRTMMEASMLEVLATLIVLFLLLVPVLNMLVGALAWGIPGYLVS
jgi:hypothetical protein